MKTTKPRKITPRINKETVRFLEFNFNTINSGAEYCLNAVPTFFSRYSTSFISHEFSTAEIKVLRYLLGNTTISPLLAGSQIPILIDDDFVFGIWCKEYNVDKDQLISKIRKMSLPELFCLEIFIFAKFI